MAAMYTPASIRTEADSTNDVKSLDRSLCERLYFVVKRNSKSRWFQFPQTIVTADDVSMTAYAELALQSSFTGIKGHGLRAHFISNMPASHLAHVYSEKFQKESGYYGVKLFFYRAQLIEGKFSETKWADYAWARESELEEFLSPETLQAVRPLLFGVKNDVCADLKYEEGEDTARW